MERVGLNETSNNLNYLNLTDQQCDFFLYPAKRIIVLYFISFNLDCKQHKLEF